jgi:hypothetical protein
MVGTGGISSKLPASIHTIDYPVPSILYISPLSPYGSPVIKTGNHYTAAQIADRFEDASDVLRRLPTDKIPGFWGLWPTIIPEFSDIIGHQPALKKRLYTNTKDIERMKLALEWGFLLSPLDVKIVWLRARRARWKEVSQKVKLSVKQSQRRWTYALCLIAFLLNGNRVHASWPIQKIIDVAPDAWLEKLRERMSLKTKVQMAWRREAKKHKLDHLDGNLTLFLEQSMKTQNRTPAEVRP